MSIDCSLQHIGSVRPFVWLRCLAIKMSLSISWFFFFLHFSYSVKDHSLWWTSFFSQNTSLHHYKSGCTERHRSYIYFVTFYVSGNVKLEVILFLLEFWTETVYYKKLNCYSYFLFYINNWALIKPKCFLQLINRIFNTITYHQNIWQIQPYNSATKKMDQLSQHWKMCIGLTRLDRSFVFSELKFTLYGILTFGPWFCVATEKETVHFQKCLLFFESLTQFYLTTAYGTRE